jgi:hypothetical protein
MADALAELPEGSAFSLISKLVEHPARAGRF